MALLTLRFSTSMSAAATERYMELRDAHVNPHFLMRQVEYAVAEMLPDSTRMQAHYFDNAGTLFELRDDTVKQALGHVQVPPTGGPTLNILLAACSADTIRGLRAKLCQEMELRSKFQEEAHSKSTEVALFHDIISGLRAELREEQRASQYLVDFLRQDLSLKEAALDQARADLDRAAKTLELERSAQARDPNMSAKVLRSEPEMAGVEVGCSDDPAACRDVSSEFRAELERLGCQQAFRVGRAKVEANQDPFPIVYAVTVENQGQTSWPPTSMLVHESGDSLGLPLVELMPVAPGGCANIALELLVPKKSEVGSSISTWVMRDVATGRPLGPILIFDAEWVESPVLEG